MWVNSAVVVQRVGSMKIKSIEPTPSPNTMKITLDEELPMGKSHNYKRETCSEAPIIIQSLLNISGVKGVYHVADFLAIERNAKYDWKNILAEVRQAFGEDTDEIKLLGAIQTDHYGGINVLVQFFKGIPLQVKVTDGSTEKRFGLPEVYTNSVAKIQKQGENYVLMRKWHEFGVRYGELEQVGHDVLEELLAAYPKERISSIIESEKNSDGENIHKLNVTRMKVTISDMSLPDWQERYRLIEQMDNPEVSDIPVLEKALSDEKASIRRLATVYLGMIKNKKVLPLLYQALKDKSVTVRRTAGDCLSDLGFEEAIEEMITALKDPNKLVRWRAAMFLYEVGDKRALSALKKAENDPEFEVSMQIKMAIERIELGEEAKGSVWKQMTEARRPDNR
jgi:hypothetical protein